MDLSDIWDLGSGRVRYVFDREQRTEMEIRVIAVHLAN